MPSWTLWVCAKHGAFIPEGEKGRDVAAHCRGPSREVEVIDRKPADDLAEAIERARDQEEWGDDFEHAVLDALKHYREQSQ